MVVFHEQVLRLVSVMSGCSLAEADEVRRQLGTPDGQVQVRTWFIPAALQKGYDLATVEKVWEVPGLRQLLGSARPMRRRSPCPPTTPPG